MAKVLPCVSPHNGAREELPQAYVVSDLSASHSALPRFWADTALIQAGNSLVLGRRCLGFGRALPCFGAGRRFPKFCGDGLMRQAAESWPIRPEGGKGNVHGRSCAYP